MRQGGRRIMALAVLAPLLGCAVSTSPAPDVGLPERFATVSGTGWPDASWWQEFRSPELDRLVQEAQAGNLDLAAAAARIEQADVQARIAGAPLLPSLDADAGGSRTRRSEGAGGGTTESYDAGLTASWELDLWGGNRAARRRALALAAAGRLDRDATALTITAGTARTYFEVLGTRERLAIARANLAAAERVLRLVEARIANGAASQLDLAQQRTEVANQRAALPSLRQQERLAVNALALLLGRPVAGFAVEAEDLAAVQPVPVVAGMPGEIVFRRPDLEAAEARLAAADADVAVARAALFPQLTLTADAGIASDALRSLLSSGNVVTLAASIFAPIFDGGARRGQVRLSQAQRLELLELYRAAVLTALADVEDALVATVSARDRSAALGIAVVEARRAFALAETQYRAGAIDLLDLLDAQRTLLGAEDALASARRDELSSQVDLYAALGGGWAGPSP